MRRFLSYDVGAITARFYFSLTPWCLFAHQVIQHLRNLRSGRCIRWEQLAIASVNNSGLYKISHGLSCPFGYLSAVGVRVFPESSPGNLLRVFRVLYRSVNTSWRVIGCSGAKRLSPTPFAKPRRFAAAR